MPGQRKSGLFTFYIVQASDLKEIFEEKKLVREEVTIASVDAISMYPPIMVNKSMLTCLS